MLLSYTLYLTVCARITLAAGPNEGLALTGWPQTPGDPNLSSPVSI